MPAPAHPAMPQGKAPARLPRQCPPGRASRARAVRRLGRERRNGTGRIGERTRRASSRTSQSDEHGDALRDGGGVYRGQPYGCGHGIERCGGQRRLAVDRGCTGLDRRDAFPQRLTGKRRSESQHRRTTAGHIRFQPVESTASDRFGTVQLGRPAEPGEPAVIE